MRSVEAILAMVMRVPDMVKREILLQQASQVLGVSISALRSKLQEQSVPKQRVVSFDKQEEKGEHETIQEQILALSVNSVLQGQALEVPTDTYAYFAPRCTAVIKALASVRATYTGQECFEQLLAACSDADRDWIISLTMKYSGTLQQQEFLSLVGKKVVQQGWKEQVSTIRSKLEAASQQGDTAQVQKLVQAFARLKQQMQQKGLIWQKNSRRVRTSSK